MKRIALVVAGIALFMLVGCAEQSETCRQVLECIQAVDEAGDSELLPSNIVDNAETAWAEDGLCWLTEETAAECEEACADAMPDLTAELEEIPPVCEFLADTGDAGMGDEDAAGES